MTRNISRADMTLTVDVMYVVLLVADSYKLRRYLVRIFAWKI